MKHNARTLVAVFALFVFALVAVVAEAGEFADLKAKLNAARDTLTVMVKEPSKRGADQQKLVKDSADAVSAALAKMKAPAGKEARFTQLVDTWAAFKKTREEEVVPMLLAGKQEQAVGIASGVQAERFKKMMTLCDELEY